MRILVTGGAGFIGSATVRLLAKQRHTILIVDNFSTGKLENIQGVRAEIKPCDVTDLPVMAGIFYDFKPDAVLHLAAQSAITTSMTDPYKDANVNAIGTINIIDLCYRNNVGKLVFASTSAVYDKDKTPFFGYNEKSPCNPSSPYGISKYAAEQYIRLLFPNHVIFRYGNVYGPRQVPIGENQVIARALKHFTHGDDFYVVGHGRQKRDFVFVEDVARINTEAAIGSMTGTFNLATGISHSVNDVLGVIEDIYKVKGYNWSHSKQPDPRGDVYINNSAIRRESGFSFTTLRAGMEKTVEWWTRKGT